MASVEGRDVLGFLFVAGVIKHTVFFLWRNRKPRNANLAGVVTGLSLYPLKSAKGIPQTDIECEAERGAHNGALLDRHWMVVTSEYAMVTARQKPTLFAIQPKWVDKSLVLTAEGRTNLVINPAEVEKMGISVNTSVHGAATCGLDCGDEASQWISTYLNEHGYRILYSGRNTHKRSVIGDPASLLMWNSLANPDDKMAFHDELSFHLCSEQSVLELNSHLEKKIDVANFRPNITVSIANPSCPYDEDSWRYVVIGNVRFRTIKLCERCVMPTIDQSECIRNVQNEPTKTMKGYRQLIPGSTKPVFGIYMIVERAGTICVGDDIYVVRGDNTAPATDF